jgi:hypothetical protein
LAPHLTPEERAGVAQELDAVGYPMAGKPAWPPAASVELRQLLGMLPHETFDATRLLEILSMLIEFSLNVEQLAWATWREIDGANTSVKKQVDLKIAIRKSITGDANTPRPVVKPGPERVQRLLSGIINNVPPVAKWAMAHFKNLSPTNLTRKLQLEGRLPMMFPQRAQWAEYEEQFAQLNEEAMKTTILRNIADGVRAKLGT